MKSELENIIEALRDRVERYESCENDMNAMSWMDMEGILMTANAAKIILEALTQRTVYVVTQGTVVRCAFSSKELAQKYINSFTEKCDILEIMEMSLDKFKSELESGLNPYIVNVLETGEYTVRNGFPHWFDNDAFIDRLISHKNIQHTCYVFAKNPSDACDKVKQMINSKQQSDER